MSDAPMADRIGPTKRGIVLVVLSARCPNIGWPVMFIIPEIELKKLAWVMDIPRRATSVGTKAGKNDAWMSLIKCPNAKRSTLFRVASSRACSCILSSPRTVGPISTASISNKDYITFTCFASRSPKSLNLFRKRPSSPETII